MIVLTCAACQTWQVRIFYDDPRFLSTIEYIKCPLCNWGVSPELQDRLRDLATRHHQLTADWKEVGKQTAEEQWTLGFP